jgi:hypothetical protein
VNREAVTRALCWAVLVGHGIFVLSWITGVIWIALLSIQVASFEGLLSVIVIGQLSLFLGVFLCGGILLFWRRCAACGYRLYNVLEMGWNVKHVQRFNEAPRLPHPHAESAFLSPGRGQIWSKARSGVAHCPWCGEQDRETARPQ